MLKLNQALYEKPSTAERKDSNKKKAAFRAKTSNFKTDSPKTGREFQQKSENNNKTIIYSNVCWWIIK